jgi:hypothetical protein
MRNIADITGGKAGKVKRHETKQIKLINLIDRFSVKLSLTGVCRY